MQAPSVRVAAVIFDMDGVVTDTAEAHAAAWKRLFDAYREERGERIGAWFEPFDAEADYRAYVDGKPRYDGVRRFLRARGIELPYGEPDDGPDKETVCGLGNRKNDYFLDWLAHHRVRTYPTTEHFVRALRSAGVKVGVFSASRNCRAVLDNAGVVELFDARVDGVDATRLGLAGKPDPAMLIETARRLGVSPGAAAVVEDAIAGVEAGARGGFAVVVGIDRGDYATALGANGADVVVRDVGELRFDAAAGLSVATLANVPSAWLHREDIRARLRDKQPAVFLDYDGTLTPIVEDYNKAFMADGVRQTLQRLAARCPVGVISGRDLHNLRNLVQLDNVFYAGSHGFDIAGPEGWRESLRKGTAFLPELDRTEGELRETLAGIAGHAVERKAFSIAVHYRRANARDASRIAEAVDGLVAHHPSLRKGHGKKVFQIQPKVDWNKGCAVLWLIDRLGLDGAHVLPFYIGDDITDEDAFRALRGRGVGIVVRDGEARPTSADYALDGVEDVHAFLETLVSLSAEA